MKWVFGFGSLISAMLLNGIEADTLRSQELNRDDEGI